MLIISQLVVLFIVELAYTPQSTTLSPNVNGKGKGF